MVNGLDTVADAVAPSASTRLPSTSSTFTVVAPLRATPAWAEMLVELSEILLAAPAVIAKLDEDPGAVRPVDVAVKV
jgi:hypothetical protein